MTEFSVRIIVISLPGIICMLLLGRLAGRRDHSSLETIFVVFVYSVLSYLIYFIFCFSCNHLTQGELSCGLSEMLSSDSYTPQLAELLGGTVSAILLAFLLSATLRFNILNRVGQKIHATNRYGDDDVWHFFHNAPLREKNDGWVFVRDHKYDLVYYGYINTWSDSGKERELVISDVSVFDNKLGEYLYSVELMYISRNRDDLTIEVPRDSIGANDGRQDKVDGRTQQTCRGESETLNGQAEHKAGTASAGK